MVDIAQQWYDLGPLNWADYLQLILTVLMIVFTIMIIAKPSRALPQPKPGMGVIPFIPNMNYVTVLLMALGLIMVAAGILTGRAISAMFWSSFTIFNFVLLIVSNRESGKRELSELESTDEI